MKISILSILLFLGTVSVQAQTMKKYSDKAGMLSIDIPAEYTVSETDNQDQSARSLKATQGQNSIYVTVTDYKFELKGDAVTRSAELIMAGTTSDVQLKKVIPFTVSGNKGTRAILYVPAQNFYIEKGVVVVGNHTVSVMVIRDSMLADDATNKMFESMSLKKM